MLVISIVELAEFNVRFVAVPVFHKVAVLVAANLHVPLPILMVRVLLLLEENKPQVTFLLLASKVLVDVSVKVCPALITRSS